ncbi:crotonobetainyl-CoA:carnitine CoA-transferase CaiB-like acyl-CoA transferase [Arthrobacter sp. GAS37]|uniref:CaiB/BaiF CoA transferase family protein n=1 Tax=Arthrobacter sp. GAS37 TaxID=3156261 RepID=UPI003836BD41
MKPLEDVRIISLEQYGAGPFGSVQLADLGAEVIKIEDPSAGGDVGRYVVPMQHGEDSLFFETFNRNKRSISLDITTAAGRAVFEDLVKVSDVVYSNLRGDVPAKLGIRYDDLKHLNPAIVCCSLTGFGMTGPRSAEPGYDYVLQGIAGWMDLTGEPDGPPTKSGLSVVDFSGGLVAAISMLAALHAAKRDGTGTDCDLSLFDTAISMLTYPAAWALNSDFVPERTHHSAHPSLIPFQAFRSADGWLVVACPKEKFWRRLVRVLERPELAEDPRFGSFAARRENSTVLVPVLEEAFLTRTSEAWLTELRAANVPCGPVNTVAEALADPHTDARNMLVRTEHPRFGTVVQVASAVRVGDEPKEHRRAPRRNEDAAHVMSDLLGYTPERLSSLLEHGAFGPPAAEAADPSPRQKLSTN